MQGHGCIVAVTSKGGTRGRDVGDGSVVGVAAQGSGFLDIKHQEIAC